MWKNFALYSAGPSSVFNFRHLVMLFHLKFIMSLRGFLENEQLVAADLESIHNTRLMWRGKMCPYPNEQFDVAPNQPFYQAQPVDFGWSELFSFISKLCPHVKYLFWGHWNHAVRLGLENPKKRDFS